MSTGTPEVQAFQSVWDAIADTPSEAADLRRRSNVMRELNAIVRAKAWSTEEAARRCSLSLPRAEALIRGRIGLFPLGALVSIATALGLRVSLEVAECAAVGGVPDSPALPS